MRTVFFGTPQFAIPTVQALIDSLEIELTGVLTQPDRPAGRGKKSSSPPVKELALQQNLDVIQPEKLKEPFVLPWLEKHNPDAIVVVAYGGFVIKSVREFAKFGCVNLHPSLLPRYRGAAPIQRAIMNGDKVTGNTSMYLSAGWDEGDMIYQEQEEILPDDTYGSLSRRLAETGADLIVRSLIDIEKGVAPRVPQPDEGIVMAPMIDNEECRVDWSQSCRDIHNHIRGLSPVPGAYTMHGDTRWKIYQTDFLPDELNEEPGTIITTAFNTIRVAAADGVVEIFELQPAGKKRMSAADYLRGVRGLSGKLT
ncbi:methionyl-tRNA formyltransferase [bacterium]|nr:methionyl-tRNA formyltransferase [bacterium]